MRTDIGTAYSARRGAGGASCGAQKSDRMQPRAAAPTRQRAAGCGKRLAIERAPYKPAEQAALQSGRGLASRAPS